MPSFCICNHHITIMDMYKVKPKFRSCTIILFEWYSSLVNPTGAAYTQMVNHFEHLGQEYKHGFLVEYVT